MGERYTVPNDLEGLRLDAAVASLDEALSRREVRRRIQSGGVYLNRKRCRVASRKVSPGDRIDVEARQAEPATALRLDILYRGDNMLAVAKPPGLPLVPTRRTVTGTLLHALALQEGITLSTFHPVHRLDAPTSGVCLIALGPGRAAALSRAFREGRVSKRYLAWVDPAPAERSGSWDHSLSAVREGKVRIDPGGRKAETRFRVERKLHGQALLELLPLTGRTHQIRVHCSHAGCPVAGDGRYGSPHRLGNRILLHARSLEITRRDDRPLCIEAPLPPDMDPGDSRFPLRRM